MTASLSIIIVNWNTREMLAQCLHSVVAQTDAEIIVVDNASSDGSVEMVRQQFPTVRLLANRENVGFARANNQAIQQSTREFLLLLNSDTVVHERALERLVVFLSQRPAVGAVGARLLNGDGSLQSSCRPMLTPAREFWRLLFLEKLYPIANYDQHLWDTVTPRQVDTLKGACLLLRRTALDQVGLLDEQYFMYTEETDICYRLSQAGWQLWYLPTAVVTHFGEAASNQVADRMYLQLYRSKVQFYRKFGGRNRARLFKSLMMIAYLPRVLLRPKRTVYKQLLLQLPGM